ncbi:uncharacterized protein LOC121262755 [Juglans microcarpa x Juglans regia]|uniref:uncharacterized protein LOC121262755 n=1 Tax=Juglans microcarpa x Juglans regia TaxID=2249226 RepID=UPI001B7F6D0B|nr:uncharacterized protein LOC121262755 [Juglans microcarpa x Juglans regia]
MGINIARGFCTKHYNKYKHFPRGRLGLYHFDAPYLIIRYPDSSKVLKLLVYSMLLALLVVSFPLIRYTIRGFSASSPAIILDAKPPGSGRESCFPKQWGGGNHIQLASDFKGNEMDLIFVTDLKRHNSILSKTFDFAWASNFLTTADFIDHTLKIDDIITIELGKNPSVPFSRSSYYKIVYLRWLDSTVIVMKKTSLAIAKKATLKNLEDVLLESP